MNTFLIASGPSFHHHVLELGLRTPRFMVLGNFPCGIKNKPRAVGALNEYVPDCVRAQFSSGCAGVRVDYEWNTSPEAKTILTNPTKRELQEYSWLTILKGKTCRMRIFFDFVTSIHENTNYLEMEPYH